MEDKEITEEMIWEAIENSLNKWAEERLGEIKRHAEKYFAPVTQRIEYLPSKQNVPG
jgi:DNA-binding protein YbaB